MLQNVSIIFLLCFLQFQCYHSRYLLIDVHGEGSGLKGPGCGDVCLMFIGCGDDPNCPICAGLFIGVCVKDIGNSTSDN